MKKRERISFDKAFKMMVIELQKSGKSSNEIRGALDFPADISRPMK